ncbi:molybdenum cofactor biosynthesis protein MoaE [Verrucomicrobiaceae bacterium N1E253]|uniref:Molybdopterin synthase catalytic subunit n=1 Tax=Oceaniferula marina TaxID=2748318 RepID=A0A851GNJ9_9BACT|nr:molybdenum cofactor biosynthesis protein MoaE [Oceaniferula marina]NWK56705.1 molybdenum cofactor biosynthesis protein MoaE [Oceaniferula marina]
MFKLTDKAIVPHELVDAVRRPDAGGLATFEGWVRDHHQGREVRSLEYESFPELAEKEGNRILQDILAEHDILEAQCIHRTGHLAIGDIAIAIAVSSAHRDAAFDACRAIIDSIKSTVPIWKKEHYTDGSSVWVKCHSCAEHQHH